jgi:UDP-2,4-diacetamido-2,4,6-trideoxy-beta-L-altropyranose hydrolase
VTIRTIAFYCDGGPKTGVGHMVRSFNLATAFAANGWHVRMLATRGAYDTASPFLDGAFEYVEAGYPADAQRLFDALADSDLAVLDSYVVDEAFESRLRRAGKRMLVIEDLADRRHHCSALLNLAPGPNQAEFVPEDCQLFLGPAFAPIAPKIRKMRAKAEALRLERRGVRKILVNFGGTDPFGLTAVCVKALAGLGVSVVAAVGSSAVGLDAVRELQSPIVEIHVDATNLADLMAESDLAIAGAGYSSWERCVLGLPSIAVCLVENQRNIAQTISEKGAAVVVPFSTDRFAEAIRNEVRRLIEDPELSARMSRAGLALCDGAGADRIFAGLS